MMIVVIGFELTKSSVQKILHPEKVEFSGVMLGVLIFSIIVKEFMMLFNRSMGKKIYSYALLTVATDPELEKNLMDYIGSCSMVVGCHDLMVHDYGPDKRYASIHVEMDQDMDVLQCHEAIDRIERECLKKFNTHMVIHHDPIRLNDPETDRVKHLVITLLKMKDERLEIHDFRMQNTFIYINLICTYN